MFIFGEYCFFLESQKNTEAVFDENVHDDLVFALGRGESLAVELGTSKGLFVNICPNAMNLVGKFGLSSLEIDEVVVCGVTR